MGNDMEVKVDISNISMDYCEGKQIHPLIELNRNLKCCRIIMNLSQCEVEVWQVK